MQQRERQIWAGKRAIFKPLRWDLWTSDRRTGKRVIHASADSDLRRLLPFLGNILAFARGCGSHSWKLLKSPICSRVQLIPNCFSNRPISYTNCTPLGPITLTNHCLFPYESLCSRTRFETEVKINWDMAFWKSYGDTGLNYSAPPFTNFLRDLIENARERTTSFELVRAANSFEIKLKKQATDSS